MRKFQSIEEFENRFINEEIPQTDLNKDAIMYNISRKYDNRKRMSKGMKRVAIAMLISIIAIPALTNGNLSYAEVYKNIMKSIYGEVVEFLPDKDDGGFKFIVTEQTEEEIEMYEKIAMMEVGESYEEIKEQLEQGECARLIHLEFYEATGGSTYIVQQPLVFKDINSIRDYGLDISIPKYIPKGYKFKEARLTFTPSDSSEETMAKYDIMAEEARGQNLVYTWEKIKDKMKSNLVMEYVPKRKADWDKSITVEINLTDYDAATQALVVEDSDYEVEIVNIGDQEVMQWNYGNESPWKYFTFKVPNREYKTYEISIVKDNPLSNKEIQKMIKSFD
ncbi:MAG TPA: hypothetical protein GX707_12550 [Epulopiscium sp.]|nr:hypothetical protein [Candidatus Epulonipiscium sp.]